MRRLLPMIFALVLIMSTTPASLAAATTLMVVGTLDTDPGTFVGEAFVGAVMRFPLPG